MVTAIAHPPQSNAQHIVLENMTWDFYSRLLDQIGDQHLFVTYDRGRLEIMSPSRKHDKNGRMLAFIVPFIAERLGLEVDGSGSTTFRREDLERGLEPDECFYVANEPAVRGKEEIDLSIDPPPDLVIEVEISRRLLDRQGIYAAMGVPELWCFDGERLRILTLDQSRHYSDATRSACFSGIQAEELVKIVKLGWTMGQVQWLKEVRAWAQTLPLP